MSAFFRDREAFEELGREAIAPLAGGCPAGETLRAWVPGCPRGAQAYSLAMLLLEAADPAGKGCPVQVIAADVERAPPRRRGLVTARNASSTRSCAAAGP